MINFPIDSDTLLSQQLRSLGIRNFHQAIDYVQNLPYGRNSERANPILVLEEGKGTCSTKHACLKQIALDESQRAIDLLIGMYRMNESNTPGIGAALENAGLPYIPEAHCYLRYQGQRYDYTNPQSDIERLQPDILEEIVIEPADVGTYKVTYHRSFIDRWLTEQQIPYKLEELWGIREQCIQSLSA